MLSNLILDIKILIASNTLASEWEWEDSPWYKLYCADEEFAEYARTDAGMRRFVMLFTVRREYEDDIFLHLSDDIVHETTLMRYIHSVNDEPAVIDETDKTWYYKSQIHRGGDLPAVVSENWQTWYQHGNLHRDGDMPARIYTASGAQEWYQNGNLHRSGDMPAKIDMIGTQEWYIDGKKHRDGDQPAVIKTNGIQMWYQRGMKHRDGDLPAIIDNDIYRVWYKWNKIHRDGDLPAIITASCKRWCINGKLHREDDKPAVIDEIEGEIHYYNDEYYLPPYRTWFIRKYLPRREVMDQVMNSMYKGYIIGFIIKHALAYMFKIDIKEIIMLKITLLIKDYIL